MRLIACCLALAPVLGGCTLTLGTTGALIDRSAARQPVARYTLDAPPPYNTPVEVVTRSGGDVAGRWYGYGMETPPGADSAASVIVLYDRRSRRVQIPAPAVVQIRSRPRRSNLGGPMMLTGLVIDGLLVFSAVQSFNNSCAFQSC